MSAWPRATDERPVSVDRLPTLTEVVELDALPGWHEAAPVPAAAPAQAELPAVPAAESPAERTAWPIDAPSASALAAAAPPRFDEAVLVALVLDALAPQIDTLFEQRLGDALAPALARAAEGLIRETRDELGPLLRALVQDAVRRALDELR
ncbi:MAG: hypothetical protein KGI90_01880 [Burkholderiales bacterium]|nr:hypothetical protein [Burkholderiales bacterium]MDE2274708.1 hypothetical protein [Burkholderiales bacterium]